VAAAGGAGGPPGYHRRGSLQVLTLATIFVFYLVCLLNYCLDKKHSKDFFIVFIKKCRLIATGLEIVGI
jgi:hypothetical protein